MYMFTGNTHSRRERVESSNHFLVLRRSLLRAPLYIMCVLVYLLGLYMPRNNPSVNEALPTANCQTLYVLTVIDLCPQTE